MLPYVVPQGSFSHPLNKNKNNQSYMGISLSLYVFTKIYHYVLSAFYQSYALEFLCYKFLCSKHLLLFLSCVFPFLSFATTLTFLSCIFFYSNVFHSLVPNRPSLTSRCSKVSTGKNNLPNSPTLCIPIPSDCPMLITTEANATINGMFEWS